MYQKMSKSTWKRWYPKEAQKKDKKIIDDISNKDDRKYNKKKFKKKELI
ncbi:MAG: hypothetical protein U0T63_00335 [Buchnera aphidicola (Nurudea shiraii)]